MAVRCIPRNVAQIRKFVWFLFTELDSEHTARSYLAGGPRCTRTHTRGCLTMPCALFYTLCTYCVTACGPVCWPLCAHCP